MRTRLSSFGWTVLVINIVVILWGAYVRATGSGAGCGSHWPLCNGDVIPRTPVEETIIEFVHRITSGVALIMVIGLVVWARRVFPRDHRARVAALASLVFIVIEALIGAALVRFDLVADNISVMRAVVLALHLMNTFFLLGALALTAWWSGDGEAITWRGHGAIRWLLPLCLIGVMLLGMSGAITALGDTLFPASSLASGILHDIAPNAHIIVRARFVHPTLAAFVGLSVIMIAGYVRRRSTNPTVRRLSYAVTALVIVQGAAGGLTVVLLAPVAMQVVHLFLADCVWVSLVLFTAAAFAQPASQVAFSRALFDPTSAQRTPSRASLPPTS